MYLLLATFSYCVAAIPVDYYGSIAKLLRAVFYDFFGMRKKLILQNLTIVFGVTKTSQEIEHIGKKCFENFILTTLECLRGFHKNFTEFVEFSNREVLDEVLRLEKGAYVLVWHGGNWEALAATVGSQIVSSFVPVKKVGGEKTNLFVTNFRLKYNVHSLISLYKGYTTKKLLEVLQENKAVGFMQDQARPGEPRLPFFGVDAKTNTSLAAIWLKHKSPIVPAFIVRESPNQHKIHFMSPLNMVETDNPDNDILENTKMFNRVLECGILLNPEQYFWLHNRWKK